MTNTRKLAYIAILSAVSFLLLYFSFPLIPAADFLKVDFSILPVLIALVIFDFKSAIGVLFRKFSPVIMSLRIFSTLFSMYLLLC